MAFVLTEAKELGYFQLNTHVKHTYAKNYAIFH